jgi:hypothetical protein
MRFIWAIVICSFVLVGCRHPRPDGSLSAQADKKSAKAAKPSKSSDSRATPSQAKILPVSEPNGKVAAVRPNLRFVVIGFQLSKLPQIDQRMNVYRKNEKVGEVKITGPIRDQNIAADIVAGEVQVGDEVRPN